MYNECIEYSGRLPFTTTIPLMGIHSLDPSGWMVGLLRAGRASKCSWTREAIRAANGVLGWSIVLFLS